MSYRFNRVFLIVLDSLGIGPMPDSKEFGDEDVDTFGHKKTVGNLYIPNMQKLGIANLKDLEGILPSRESTGIFYAYERNE